METSLIYLDENQFASSSWLLSVKKISTGQHCEARLYRECKTTFMVLGEMKIEGGTDVIYPKDMKGRQGCY